MSIVRREALVEGVRRIVPLKRESPVYEHLSVVGRANYRSERLASTTPSDGERLASVATSEFENRVCDRPCVAEGAHTAAEVLLGRRYRKLHRQCAVSAGQRAADMRVESAQLRIRRRLARPKRK